MANLSSKLILSKQEVDIANEPIIFLAGPINGGNNWQETAITIIHGKDPAIFIASPHKCVKGQLPWERKYMDLAAHQGCLLFWLPKKDPEYEEQYAKDTRGELGEWRGRMMFDKNIRLVIGAEEGFEGKRTVKENYELALKKTMDFYEKIEITCQAAICVARGLPVSKEVTQESQEPPTIQLSSNHSKSPQGKKVFVIDLDHFYYGAGQDWKVLLTMLQKIAAAGHLVGYVTTKPKTGEEFTQLKDDLKKAGFPHVSHIHADWNKKIKGVEHLMEHFTSPKYANEQDEQDDHEIRARADRPPGLP